MKCLVCRTVAGLAGLSLALAGCGDDKESATTPERPSKSEFVASADRLCMQYGEESHSVIDALPPFEEIASPNVTRRVMLETARGALRIAAAERGLERALRALDPPADLDSRWDRALGALGTRAAAAEDIGTAGQKGDRSAYLRGFQRFQQAGSASTAALRGYGFRACARG